MGTRVSLLDDRQTIIGKLMAYIRPRDFHISLDKPWAFHFLTA